MNLKLSLATGRWIGESKIPEQVDRVVYDLAHISRAIA